MGRLLFFGALLLSVSGTWAGPTAPTAFLEQRKIRGERVPHEVFEFESSYVLESDLNHGGSFGQQDEFYNSLEYGRRFLLSRNYYFRLGFAYNRFDFGRTSAPVPLHLQSFAGVVGIEYMQGENVGAFVYFRPGIYTENDIGTSSFNVPITLGRIFVIKSEKLYVFLGANADFLRGTPIIPLGGVIWMPCEKFRLMGVLPEPRIIYSPTSKLDLWIGCEVVGGSFRTDRNENIQTRKLRGAQVDYEDFRAGVGIIYNPCDAISVDFGAGYAIERGFKFHRAGENYRTDPAPYLRLEVKANF